MWHSTIIGNVGDDAEMKTVGDGKQVLSFSVGVKTGRENTEWAQVSVWGKYAEMIADSVKKGSRVTIVGKVSGVDVYQKRDGGFGKSVKFNADSVDVHRSKDDAPQQQMNMGRPSKPKQEWNSAPQQQPQQQQWQSAPQNNQGQWGAPQQQSQQQQQWQASPSNQSNDPIPF